MSQSVSRRQFLRGDFGNRRPALRPPWALAEAEFTARCNQCGECLAACETRILEAGDGGYPQVNFARGECRFCAACVARCPTGALARTAAAPWALTAVVNRQTCLAHRGVVCQVCGEYCAARAIGYTRTRGVVSLPILDLAACTGCGACVAPCPVQAVSIHAAYTEESLCT